MLIQLSHLVVMIAEESRASFVVRLIVCRLPKRKKKKKKRAMPASSLLLKNCTLWRWTSAKLDPALADGSFADAPMDVLIESGVITEISEDISLPPSCTVLDVEGRLVLPGLIDSHIHVGMTGEANYLLDCSGCSSIASLVEAVREHCELHPDLTNVVGIGWDQEKLGRMPTKEDLDEACSGKLVWLWRACWVSASLQICHFFFLFPAYFCFIL